MRASPAEYNSALPALPTTSRGYYLWCFGYLLFEEDEVFFFEAAEEGL